MVARIFVIGALIVLGAGFLWFAGNVIYLGVREFFRQKIAPAPTAPTAAPAAPTAAPAPTAPTAAPAAPTAAPAPTVP